jgi:hypothetical protein
MSENQVAPPRKGGQPALYKEEYDQLLVTHMSQGYSFESFGADVGCGRRTLFDWVERYPSFKEAQKEGYEKGKKLFEGILMAKVRGLDAKGMDLKKSDTACLIFALKTRYRDTYSEKVEVSHSGDIKINIDNDDSNL